MPILNAHAAVVKMAHMQFYNSDAVMDKKHEKLPKTLKFFAT